MKEQRRGGGRFRTVAAFGLGATVGSIIALLYAPASGQVTRRRLAMKARTLQRATMRRLGQTQRALATRAVLVRQAAQRWITNHSAARNGNGRHPIRHRTVRHAHAN